jgi:hypothetical protein
MKKLMLLLTLSAVTLLTGCIKDDIPDIPANEDLKETNLMVLGKKLENPYSVANMRMAYEELSPQTRALTEDLASDELIYTTHHYVRFKPQTDEELGVLKSDSTLLLYPYPLDYEIISYGEYHDPSVPEDQPTYYYASVPADKELTDEVEWEILEDLYIPDEYDIDEEPVTRTRSGTSLNEDFIESLVDKALDITGNIEPQSTMTRAKSSWRPAGYITYFDDATNRTIGLEGVKVRARRWFTTYTGFANASTGYYSCSGTFRRDANYYFDLERSDFHVKGDGVKTDFDGPKKTGNWNYAFRRSTNETEFAGATVFRAAYHYYYKNIGGLRRPPENSFWKQQMNIKMFDEGGRSNAYPARRWFDGNPVKLYSIRRSTMDLYAVTIHELAHTAHWRMIVKASGSNRNTDYNNADNKMCESWAMGVQHYLTRMVYPNYSVGNMGSDANYTRVVIDMIDTEANHTAIPNGGHSSVQGDNVTGYTMPQIETALIGCNTWEKWKNNIKNKYTNATESNVDALFASW